MGYVNKRIRNRSPSNPHAVTEGTGVNTRGGQVLMRYQHLWFHFKVRPLLRDKADRFRVFRRPHCNNMTDGLSACQFKEE